MITKTVVKLGLRGKEAQSDFWVQENVDKGERIKYENYLRNEFYDCKNLGNKIEISRRRPISKFWAPKRITMKHKNYLMVSIS